MAGGQQYEVTIWIEGPGRFLVDTPFEPDSQEWQDRVLSPLVNRHLCTSWEKRTEREALQAVACARCGDYVPAEEMRSAGAGKICAGCWDDLLEDANGD